MNKSILTVIAVFASLVVFLAGFRLAAGQEEDPVFAEDESVQSENCVSLTMLKNTEVVDDRNVIFHMRGNKMFRNVLPRRCPGLARNEAFSYRTSMNRLCASDMITVLPALGPGNFPGATCSLGKFYAISQQELEALTAEVELIEELDLE